ncbi:hypothetical protein [Micropruina sp.]|uniref:hypothetical protein n=1 Tax=Micropruina sp. TaxID=2737536 RepID=UPI00260BBF0F|nr:hypothetical protein [Micropruina sp.]
MTDVIGPHPSGKVGGWLLALSPLYFVILIAVNVWAFSANRIGLFVDITREQMDAIILNWVLANAIVTLTWLAGALGVVLISRVLLSGAARRWAALSVGVTVAAALAYLVSLVLRLTAVGFTGSRLGDDPSYALSEQIVNRVGWFGALIGVGLLCVALAVSRTRRVTGIVVGSASAVVLLLSVLAYDLTPPFLFGLLWTPIGITWLTGLRRTRR